jgi:hypothetical protein
MTRLLRLAVPLLIVAAAVPASGDVVTTKGGLSLEGPVTRSADGSVTVATETGDVRIEADDVGTVAAGEGPRARAKAALSEADPDDVQANYRLAVAFEADGLVDLAKRAYERVVDADPDHAAARRALGYEKVDGRWAEVAVARRKSGLVLFRGEWLLPAEVRARTKGLRVVAPRDKGLLDAMRTAARSRGALRDAAAQRIAKADHDQRLEATTALVVDRDANVRRWAVRELASIGDQSALRALVAVSVRDRAPEVREAAVKAAASFGVDEIAIPLVRALGSEHDGIVANAAQALAVLGDRRAVGYLIRRTEGHGSSPSAYISQIQQTSYIQDFDVEVAQTSFIADPIVGTIQEGAIGAVTVLDAMIQKTTVTRILLDAASALAGVKFASAGDAKAWYNANAPTLPDFTRRAEADEPR